MPQKRYYVNSIFETAETEGSHRGFGGASRALCSIGNSDLTQWLAGRYVQSGIARVREDQSSFSIKTPFIDRKIQSIANPAHLLYERVESCVNCISAMLYHCCSMLREGLKAALPTKATSKGEIDMTEYLITDLMTLKNTWIAAPTVTAALIQHENAKRLSNGGVTLSEKSRASHYSQGNVIDASLATSACRGLRTNVVRD